MDIWARVTFGEIVAGDTIVTGDGYAEVLEVRPYTYLEDLVSLKLQGGGFKSYNRSGTVYCLTGSVTLHTPALASKKAKLNMPRQVLRLEDLAQALGPDFNIGSVGETPT